MCNQANRWARRQQRGTSWLRSLKTCDVLPALAFCYSAKLSVCISHNLCLWVFLLLSVKLHQAFSSLPESSLWGGSFHQCSSRCWPRFRRGGAAAALVGFAVGFGRGNGDGLVPIFFLTCQIRCPLYGFRSPFCGLFPPGGGLCASPIFLWGGWCEERWWFSPSVPTVWGVIWGVHSCGC